MAQVAAGVRGQHKTESKYTSHPTPPMSCNKSNFVFPVSVSLCYLYCDLIPPQCVHSRPVIGTPSPPCHWRSRADPAALPRRSVLCRDGPPLWCWWWWLVHLEGGWVEGEAIKTWICGGITNGWVTQFEGSASCCLQPILFYCLIFANSTRKRWRRRRREKPPEGDSRRYYVDKVVVPKDK